MQTLNYILSNWIRYHYTRLPRWRSGHAVDCRSTTLRFKSGPWLSPYCEKQYGVAEYLPASKTSKTRGGSGHSFRATPGLIPNPAVKPEHVVYCTEVRESSGTIPSCYHLSFLHGILQVFFTQERSISTYYHSAHGSTRPTTCMIRLYW